jgi:hypothetical protein
MLDTVSLILQDGLNLRPSNLPTLLPMQKAQNGSHPCIGYLRLFMVSKGLGCTPDTLSYRSHRSSSRKQHWLG